MGEDLTGAAARPSVEAAALLAGVDPAVVGSPPPVVEVVAGG